jgi:CBS domain-containing protein
MDRAVSGVEQTTPLTDVLEGLLLSSARELTVLDADRRPVGVITATDVVARIDAAERPGILLILKSRVSRGAAQELRRKVGKRAGDIMSSPVVTIAADAHVIDALSLMVAKHIKHLAVVDPAGKLVGVLSRAAVLAASLTGDAA